MPGQDDRRARVRSPLSRRGFLQTAVGTTGLLLLTACGGATAPAAPTTAPAKPTEAPKPAAPAASPAAGASPAAAASPAAGASPAASPAAGASPAASPGSCRSCSSRAEGQPVWCTAELPRLGQLHPHRRRLHQEADRGLGDQRWREGQRRVRERQRCPAEARRRPSRAAQARTSSTSATTGHRRSSRG